jgi:hypothetical protein
VPRFGEEAAAWSQALAGAAAKPDSSAYVDGPAQPTSGTALGELATVTGLACGCVDAA